MIDIYINILHKNTLKSNEFEKTNLSKPVATY